MTRSERHRALRFVCNCDACRPGNPSQQLSDMRRKLLRGLQYLETGRDLGGKKRAASGQTLIVDSQLKSAAENFDIPLSSRLVYGLMKMFLLEQEGLPDEFQTKRLSPNIRATADFLQTKGNIRVAKLAMAQGTWFGKLCMALSSIGELIQRIRPWPNCSADYAGTHKVELRWRDRGDAVL